MLLTQNIHVQYNIYSTVSSRWNKSCKNYKIFMYSIIYTVSSSWNKSCKYCNVYRIINTYIGTTQCYGAAPFLGRLRLRLRFLAQSIFVISLKNFINVCKEFWLLLQPTSSGFTTLDWSLKLEHSRTST